MSVEVLNESGIDLDVAEFAKLARFTMGRMRVHPEAELCVRLVDEATIAEYNQRWMGKEGPTDVLSFPMDELRPGREGEPEPEGILGDMLLCPQYATAQAPSFQPHARRRDAAADDPRHPAPARLRPCRARGGTRDVRAPGSAAGRVARREER